MIVAKVRFAPGSRTAWHSHARGQTLHVTQGIAWVQSRGGGTVELHAGQTVAKVRFAPGSRKTSPVNCAAGFLVVRVRASICMGAPQASGIWIPKFSRVICSGSGPPRTPVSRASIAASWSAVSSKSKRSKFSTIREGVTDFGMA